MTYSVLISLFNVRSITYNGIKGIKCPVFDPQLQYAKIVFVHVGGTQLSNSTPCRIFCVVSIWIVSLTELRKVNSNY